MSRINKNGIVHNSFYETPSELGVEERSEEELIEYKRLIGMPIAEDYDELISSLKTDLEVEKDELEKIRPSEKIFELNIDYIVDAIIDVKSKKFGERFTSTQEVLIIKELIQLKLKKKELKVEFFDIPFNYPFRTDNDVITKIKEDQNLKDNISDEQIKEEIYDEKFIYYCLCEILNNKLNNSIEHTCRNCNSECCGALNKNLAKDCGRWSHDFENDCKKNLGIEECQLIKEVQFEYAPVKTLKRNINE